MPLSARLGDEIIVGTVLVDPRAAMDLHHRRKGSGPTRAIQPGEHRRGLPGLVLGILDYDVVADIGRRCRHTDLLQ